MFEFLSAFTLTLNQYYWYKILYSGTKISGQLPFLGIVLGVPVNSSLPDLLLCSILAMVLVLVLLSFGIISRPLVLVSILAMLVLVVYLYFWFWSTDYIFVW